MTRFARHSPWTDPGAFRHHLAPVTADVGAVVDAIAGLYVHTNAFHLYDWRNDERPAQSRTTLPLEKRLARIVSGSDTPLSEPRPPERREVGTCRDYALATCGFLREKGIAARIRCGFAAYFEAGHFEDHWVCEYRPPSGEGHWTRADAQLDPEHRAHLDIRFDPTDMPQDVFVTARQAWQMITGDGVSPHLFGHGETTGAWFVWVNLVRDCLALNEQLTSPWDGWRAAVGSEPALLARGQKTSALVIDRICASEAGAPIDPPSIRPFWIDS